MGSPYVPAGPAAASTSPASQFIVDPMPTPQSSSNGMSISPASTTSIIVFLSFITLATLVVAVICWTRRRRKIADVSDERSLEKAPVCDVEATAVTRPFVPVAPLPDARWTPQIRSISGPAPGKVSDRKSAPRRARSPSNLTKPRNLFLNPPPKSAPARALSFSQNEVPYLEKSWGEELDPPVTPLALAVSGMQTRTLGKLGPKS